MPKLTLLNALSGASKSMSDRYAHKTVCLTVTHMRTPVIMRGTFHPLQYTFFGLMHKAFARSFLRKQAGAYEYLRTIMCWLAIVKMIKYLTKVMNWYFNFVGFSLAFAKKKK